MIIVSAADRLRSAVWPNMHFTLYSRSYCHLCDDMLQALQRFAADRNLSIEAEIIDVDADPGLLAQYDELVPVLTASKNGTVPVQICHYFLDEARLHAFIVEGL